MTRPRDDPHDSATDATPVWRPESKPEEAAPAQIGCFRILQELGRGGMGVVYLGVRDDGRIKRRVAIKVLKKGMDTSDVLRRFELERQLLAALNHPNIARLYEGGETDDGVPFFALEYVEGVPFDDYCDRQRLPIAKRLELFREICLAVHHAHQNLVVHRDLKPGNILVSKDGVPKLLDFGIAKLINPDLSGIGGDPTLPHRRAMTPEYASPEQVRGDPLTTASDIYSLGVVLYELVSGHRPYRIDSRVQSDWEHVVCEVDPEKPSTAVRRTVEGDDRPDTSTSITPESVSRTREGRPDRLRKRLSGDIDNIVLRAMRKEPWRRYASAEQFADDIRRHLNGLPVIARPATVRYRCAKFVRRNRVAVAAAALVAIALIAGIIGTTSQARRANRERDAAMAAQTAEQEQRERAERMVRQVLGLAHTFMDDFYVEISDLDGSLPAQQLLATTASQYLDGLVAEVGEDAELKRELARAYSVTGDITGNMRGLNRGDTAGAMALYQKSFELRKGLAAAAPDDEEIQYELSASYARLGDVYRLTGNLAAARSSFAEALRIRDTLPSDDVRYQEGLAHSLNDYAAVLKRGGDLDEARLLYERSLVITKALAALNPEDARVQRTLSVVRIRLCDIAQTLGDEEAAVEHGEAAERIRAALVEQDPDSGRLRRDHAVVRFFLGDLYLAVGEPSRALEQANGFVSDAERRIDSNPEDARARFDLAYGLELLGRVHQALDDPAGAGTHFRESSLLLTGLINRDPDNQRYRGMLGRVEIDLGDVAAETRDEETALRRYRRARHIGDELAELDPMEVRWQKLRDEAAQKIDSISSGARSERPKSPL